MARKLLNAKSVEHLKPSDRRQEISDAKVPALRIVISPTGARSWALRTRVGGRPVKFTLGSADSYTLRQAREWASDTLLAVKAGRDPRAEKREREDAAQLKREEEERKRRDTVAAVVERWLATDQKDNRTVGEVAAIMRLYVLPAWGEQPIGRIKKCDVVELVERVAEGDGVRRGAPIRANRLLAHVKRLFAWAAHRDLIEVSPATAVERPAREVSRDRVLDDDELAAIWRAAEDLDAYGRLVRLLIATGCRLSEIAEAKVEELVEDNGMKLRLPAERSKNGIARTIHLSNLALEVLAEPKAPYLGVDTGKRPVTNLSERKRLLDEKAAEILGRPLAPWRIHDARRTVATNMQRAGVRLEVTEAVLGHTSGSRNGVVGVYQRHQWTTEAAAALDRWGDRLTRLLTTESAKVVRMRRRQG